MSTSLMEIEVRHHDLHGDGTLFPWRFNIRSSHRLGKSVRLPISARQQQRETLSRAIKLRRRRTRTRIGRLQARCAAETASFHWRKVNRLADAVAPAERGRASRRGYGFVAGAGWRGCVFCLLLLSHEPGRAADHSQSLRRSGEG